MQYMIIGRIVDEMFDNKGECIVGYYVIDDNGKCNFGAVSKIYQLYQEGKIKGAKGFNANNGEIDFANADNSLLPKYSMTLFNGIGASGNICSVSENGGVYVLKDASGQTKRFTEQDIVNGVKSGTIRLNNATVSKGTLSINKSISILGVQTKNGEQVGYKVALPNGDVKVLSKADVVEKLIKEQGLQLFNAKLDGNGNIIAKSGTLPTKALDGIERADGMPYTDTFYIIIRHKLEQVTVQGKYSGMLKNGKPNGKGVFTSSSYNISYNGDYVNGVKQGTGLLQWSYSKNTPYCYTYKGDIKDNYFDGKGVLSGRYRYEGIFAKGKEVSGKYTKDKQSYIYKRDLKTNKSMYSYNNGEITIIGDFEDFVIAGNGKLVCKDKYTYVGMLVEQGQIMGKGTLTFTDGTRVESEVWGIAETLNSCKITYSNGNIYEGSAAISYERQSHSDEYINGKMTYANGDVYMGQWKGSLQDGHGTMIYADGTKYVGLWANGKPCSAMFKLEEPICNENGYLLGYSIKCPDGKIVKLRCDDICKLASNPKVFFEDELYSACCYFVDGHYKVNIDLLALYTDVNLDSLVTYTNIDNILNMSELRKVVCNCFKNIIVPNNEKSAFVFHEIDNNLDYLFSSKVETIILPSNLKEVPLGIPVSNLKYSNAILNAIQCIAISNDKSRDMFVKEYKRVNSKCISDLAPFSEIASKYVDTLYKENKGMICNGAVLETISSDIVKDGVFEVPDGIKEVILYGLANKGIKHLILPATIENLMVDTVLYAYIEDWWGNNSISGFYGQKAKDDLVHLESIDLGLFKTLKSITFKGNLQKKFKDSDIQCIIKFMEFFSSRAIRVYLQQLDYAKYKDISPIVHCVTEKATLFRLDKPVCDKNGLLLGYHVKYPDGTTKKLSCDTICDLAANKKVHFEGDAFYDYYEVADDGSVHVIDGVDDSFIFSVYDIFILPSNVNAKSCDCDFVDGGQDAFRVYDYSDRATKSKLEIFIVPSTYKEVDFYTIPLGSMKYTNAIHYIASNWLCANDELKSIFYKVNNGFLYGGTSYHYGGSMVDISDTLKQSETLRVPEGIASFFDTALKGCNIKHLILSPAFNYFLDGYNDVSITETTPFDDIDIFCAGLKDITFEHRYIDKDFLDLLDLIKHNNPRIIFYVSKENYETIQTMLAENNKFENLKDGCIKYIENSSSLKLKPAQLLELVKPVCHSDCQLYGYTVKFPDGIIGFYSCENIRRWASANYKFKDDCFPLLYDVVQDGTHLIAKLKPNVSANVFATHKIMIVPKGVMFDISSLDDFKFKSMGNGVYTVYNKATGTEEQIQKPILETLISFSDTSDYSNQLYDYPLCIPLMSMKYTNVTSYFEDTLSDISDELKNMLSNDYLTYTSANIRGTQDAVVYFLSNKLKKSKTFYFRASYISAVRYNLFVGTEIKNLICDQAHSNYFFRDNSKGSIEYKPEYFGSLKTITFFEVPNSDAFKLCIEPILKAIVKYNLDIDVYISDKDYIKYKDAYKNLKSIESNADISAIYYHKKSYDNYGEPTYIGLTFSDI